MTFSEVNASFSETTCSCLACSKSSRSLKVNIVAAGEDVRAGEQFEASRRA
eukprot:CAMPEP_0172831620 /NCGR_PEP_ID=MMETSP1075-20121228/23099_1 /TAXON_ID=2916 /ORGANISM="Ceratium fusus, Strain PA161109" /LENGTH=50 /DNA_ID=CAMNT_0013674113 /DNA_START=117 /DNA_END=266 /DNA_ORIENTATION=-